MNPEFRDEPQEDGKEDSIARLNDLIKRYMEGGLSQSDADRLAYLVMLKKSFMEMTLKSPKGKLSLSEQEITEMNQLLAKLKFTQQS